MRRHRRARADVGQVDPQVDSQTPQQFEPTEGTSRPPGYDFGTTPPVEEYVPSLDFSESRNSQYLPLVFRSL